MTLPIKQPSRRPLDGREDVRVDNVRRGEASVSGAGLGLRRSLLGPLEQLADDAVDFMEVAPENWIGVGGRLGKAFRGYSERYPVCLHGLSLNIGGPDPLDLDFLARLRRFMDEHQCPLYSEHLTYCAEQGHLYDLMPIPFTGEAVAHVVARVERVQEALGRRIALENASYYAAPGQEMSELEFINEVVARADCELLLDVNNIYVNAINHGYDAMEFLAGLPGHRATYFHVAGHYVEAEDLRVDTHGSAVIEPVWHLLADAYRRFGVRPTLLERDFNIPPVDVLLGEVRRIREIQRRVLAENTDACCIPA